MTKEAEKQPPLHSRRWKRRWTVRLVLTAILMVMVTLFAAANYVLVEVRLIIWEGEVRLAWALIVASVSGAVFMLAALRFSR